MSSYHPHSMGMIRGAIPAFLFSFIHLLSIQAHQ